ncbi:MAG: hypothetical protein J6Y78_05765 [Paludibacteraceae bacterium]|nr:hypothetical protein [Paludibacteraceae bacterium]
MFKRKNTNNGKRRIGCKDALLRHFSDRSNQYDLAPVYINKTDENGKPNSKYGPVEDIANKLGDENVKNIALTGPYGSGKSSVLRTLMRDYPKARYLNISLATLEDDTLYKKLVEEETKEKEKQGGKAEKNKTLEKDKEEINHLIEYSILQQIIYKEKAQKLRQSRLKRIQDMKWHKALLLAAAFVIAVIAALVLFEPKFFRIDTLYNFFSCRASWKTVWDIVCFAYLIVFFVFVLWKLIISTYNSKINKLNIKNVEIGIAENTSIFNKHLDEIVYFFEVTNYNVVIIEDLDRFETNHIFLKLRELNQLLNSSNSIGRRIVFVYAVRDDIFNDTNRTKFFDYITTVIPVINYSNAKDMLFNAFQQHGITEIPESTCKELGLYIDDMRMLYNIVDEFIQYHSRLGKGLLSRDLLGMIVYKNYFPKDFAELHNREGVVYKIISNKKKYQDELLANLYQKKKELEEILASEESRYQSTVGKELRSLYVSKYLLESRFKVLFFIGSNDRVSPQDLIDDETKFQKLINNEFKNYEVSPYYNRGGTIEPLNLLFENIEKQVDPQYGYLQRLDAENEIIKKRKKEIEQVDDEIAMYHQKNLAQLLSSFEIKAFQEDISGIEDKNRLIEFLLKNGYINEYYYDYISYFYPAMLTPQDKEFITDLRVGRKKDYNYQLVKIESIIEEITSELYFKVGVLNIFLVKHIADHVSDSQEMSSRLDKIVRCIKRYKEKDFVYAFYQEYDNCSVLFDRLFKKWNSFDTECLHNGKEPNKEKFNVLFEAFLRYVSIEDIPEDNVHLNDQICDSFGWINESLNRIGLKKTMDLIQTRNLRFKELNAVSINKELMNYIIDGCYFERSGYNLLNIVSFLDSNMIQSYKTASMTTIKKLGNNTLIDDMDNNLQEYIECFPESSGEESEETLLFIVNNYELNDSIEAYLNKQHNKISDIDALSDNEKKKLALKTNIVETNWENIEKYINTDSDNINSEELVGFISSNIEELSKQDAYVLSEGVRETVITRFLGSNVLDVVVYEKIRWAFPLCFKSQDLSTLESDRMALLIESRGVAFNNYYYDLILNCFPKLLLQFIYEHIKDFINGLGSYYIPSNVAIWLLKDTSIKKKDRVSIIYAIPDDIEQSADLAALICGYYREGNLDDIGDNRIQRYISWLDNVEDKIKTFVCYAEKEQANDETIKSFLNELGGPYREIASQKGLRPKLEITDYHLKMLDLLKQRRFISTYSEHNGYYKVNTRNV